MERLLTLWELACARDDALGLLAHACPDVPEGALARLPLGRRTDALLDLRERLFGPRMPAQAVCPACGAPLELDLSLPDLRAADPPAPDATCLVEQDGWRLHMRLPSAADVAAAAAHRGPDDPRRVLLARCLLELTHHGEPRPPTDLPDALIAPAAAAVAALDPNAEISLALTCSACDHAFVAAFDVLPFLRAELRAHAVRLARQVDALARAYGWSEAAILALSPARRRLYLDLVDA